MKIKDKNRPKSPMTSFACFVQVIREKHSSLHPIDNVIFSEFAKKCAEKWRQMPSKDREPFDEMCRLDIKRYNREMGEYVQPEGLHLMNHHQQHEDPCMTGHRHHRGTKRRRIKDPGMPKRSWSAFFFFCDEVRPHIREEHPEWKVSDIAKELGRRWEDCRDKTVYEASAQNDKQRYEEDMRKYKAGSYVMVPKRNKDLAAAMLRSETASTVGLEGVSGFEIEGSREVDDVEQKSTSGKESEEADEEEEEDEEERGLVVDGEGQIDQIDGPQQEEDEEEDVNDEYEDNEEKPLKVEVEETSRHPSNSFSVAFVSGNHQDISNE